MEFTCSSLWVDDFVWFLSGCGVRKCNKLSIFFLADSELGYFLFALSDFSTSACNTQFFLLNYGRGRQGEEREGDLNVQETDLSLSSPREMIATIPPMM